MEDGSVYVLYKMHKKVDPFKFKFAAAILIRQL